MKNGGFPILILLMFFLGTTSCDFKPDDLVETYSYGLGDTFCETGRHSFNTLSAYCAALQSDSLNNNCARSQRQDLFYSKCSGNF